MRTCPDCGVPESRTKDGKGRELVNLDPVSGRCVNCLVKVHTSFTSRRMPEADDLPFDARAAAARNED